MRIKIKDQFIVNALDGFRAYAHGRGVILPKNLVLFKAVPVVFFNNKLSDVACAGQYFISVSEDKVSYWLKSEYNNDIENGKSYSVCRSEDEVIF